MALPSKTTGATGYMYPLQGGRKQGTDRRTGTESTEGPAIMSGVGVLGYRVPSGWLLKFK